MEWDSYRSEYLQKIMEAFRKNSDIKNPNMDLLSALLKISEEAFDSGHFNGYNEGTFFGN